jgi:preprotein translocase subunit YajC
MSFLIMMLLIFVVMYFFMIRPQQKKQKEIAKFRNELKKGDKIVTIGGIYGTVDEIREKYVIIVVDGDVKLRVDKSAIVKDMSDVPAK